MTYSEELAANLRNWDERVDGHLTAYGVEGFVGGTTTLTEVVRTDLETLRRYLPGGSPQGLDLVHLQCHIGLDTLSWARLGAAVTGVDFSAKAIAAAEDISRRARLTARFVESDIDRAADVLDEQFDVVYTGIGVLPWLPDLERWALVVARLLKPGGVFYIRDAHPVLNALDYDRADGELVLRNPYFATGAPLRYDEGTTYADPDIRLDNATTYEWPHSLADIIGSLLEAGLTLLAFDEQRSIPWQALTQLVRGRSGYALPTNPERLPLTFSLTARK